MDPARKDRSLEARERSPIGFMGNSPSITRRNTPTRSGRSWTADPRGERHRSERPGRSVFKSLSEGEMVSPKL